MQLAGIILSIADLVEVRFRPPHAVGGDEILSALPGSLHHHFLPFCLTSLSGPNRASSLLSPSGSVRVLKY